MRSLTRVEILKEAKDLYIDRFQQQECRVGLCDCIAQILIKHELVSAPVIYYDDILLYIPKFTPPSGRYPHEFWWPLCDKDSRIAFIDKLIDLYKDDATNLLDLAL